MPERIQMTRQKPWRADHPNAVIVARPSRWGNPFRIGHNYLVLNDMGWGSLALPGTDKEN